MNIEKFGYKLPKAPEPAAVYVPAVRVGDIIYVSGQTPKDGNELLFKGKLGKDFTLEEGYEASKVCILRSLSVVEAEIGNLDKIKRIVKLTGYVNSTDDFTDHSKVINGASELLEEVFGEKGRHARVAVGTNSLPGNAAVEIELIVQVENY
ncbi:MAG: RidA family protein [Bacillota bacterium]|nr:RidA family protein [Bacillota bacterium]